MKAGGQSKVGAKTFVKFVVLVFLMITTGEARSQDRSHSLMGMANDLMHSFDRKTKKSACRPFQDPRRKTWDRIPKIREGLKLSELSISQKRQMHQLLQACLSREGYLLVTAIMFNEDIQQKFEPELGRNEYWLEIFGNPAQEEYWAWQLEGHHLSLNFTFKGNEMISHTPFLIGSNPQVVDSDEDRNGLNFIYEEESLAGELVRSFDEKQKTTGYAESGISENMYGEIHRDGLQAPDDGIGIGQFNMEQKNILSNLLMAYAKYFRLDPKDVILDFPIASTQFYFIGEFDFDGHHYYRIKNEKVMIECENYGNHTHHLWRSTNDFGAMRLD